MTTLSKRWMLHGLLFHAVLAATPGLRADPYPQTVLNAGPVAYWRFESVNDVSVTNSFTNTFQGDANVTAAGDGVPLTGVADNRALVLDGNNDSVRTGVTNQLAFSSNGTFMAWVNFSQLPGATGRPMEIILKSHFNSPLDFLLDENNRLLGYAGDYRPVFYDANPAFATNTWYHLAFAFDNAAGFKRLYLNGVLVGDLPLYPNLTSNTDEIIIGNSSVFTDRSLNGRIDEVALFERALSGSEIQTIFASGGVSTPAPQPVVRVNIEIVREINALERGMNEYYGLAINFSISPIPFNSTNKLFSANTNFVVRIGGLNGGVFDGSGYLYLTLGEALQTATNGLWTLILNEGATNEATYHFSLTATNLTTNDFAIIDITSPLDGSVGNAPDVEFTWAQSHDWPINHIDLDGPTFARARVPSGATNWTNAPNLNYGKHDLNLYLLTNAAPWVTISTPTNSSHQPLPDWDGGVQLTSRRGIRFRVGEFMLKEPGLQAHLRFDEEYLGLDSSGQDNHAGTSWYGEQPTYTPDGTNGGAASFTYGGWLDFNQSFSPALGGDFTVAVWVKTTQQAGNEEDQAYDGPGIVWGDYGGSGNDAIPLALNSTKAAFMTGNPDETLHSTNDVTTGEWVHLAVTRILGTGQKNIYVNGVLDSTGHGYDGLINDIDRVSVGYGNITYNGLLDDLQIYSLALSDSEVAFLYANPGDTLTNFNQLGEAVDAPQLVWRTGGDVPWFSQTDTTHDVVDAAQSGLITDDQESWIETTVVGPGQLSFWWKVSSEETYDFLKLTMDGNPEGEISGEIDWENPTLNIPPGVHTLRWSYTKNDCCEGGDDAAWLDEVVYDQDTNPLGRAVDAPQYTWTTGGSRGWFGQTNTTYDGIDAAQSGAIGDNEQSDIETVVTGPKTVSFWWKVSSEQGAFINDDYLAFIVDGNFYYRIISGEEDWSYEEWVIPPGQHNIRWRYQKNSSGAEGLDAAWLDEVSFSDDVSPQLTLYPVGTNAETGATITLAANAFGNPSPAFQWYRNNQPVTDATNATLTITNAQVADSGNYLFIASNTWGTVSANATVRIYVPTDLFPFDATAPAVAGSQGLIPIRWSVTNTGPGAVSNWFDAVYFGTNAGSASFLGQNFLAPLGTPLPAGATYSLSNNFRIPAVPAGNYSVFIRVDNGNAIIETNETNNTFTVPITVLNPDLQPGAFQALSGGVAGLPFQVRWSTTNNGPANLDTGVNWTDQIFLSTDAVRSTDDISVTTMNQFPPNLAPGQFFTRINTFTMPVVPSGDYHLILRVDNFGFVDTYGNFFEADESNNTVVLPVHITSPDLTPISLNAPAEASTLQPVQVQWQVQNIGDAAATRRNPFFFSEWDDNLYLSTNNAIDASSIKLGIFSGTFYAAQDYSRTTPLPAGQIITNLQTVYIPNVAEGNYYLVVSVDNYSSVTEINETNNRTAVPIIIANPDLVPVTLSAPATADSQSSIPVIWNVQNQGAGTAYPQWTDRVYLSTNNTYEPQDILLGAVQRNSLLASGSNYFATNLVTIPGVAPGNYFFIVRVDSITNLFESNRSNNFRALPVNIASPDLAVAQVTAPSSVSSQQPINVTFVVTNMGATTAQPNWSDHLYFSTNATLEAGDISVSGNFLITSPLTAAGSYTQEVDVTVPSVPAGEYFLLVQADSANSFSEIDESNNVFAHAVRVENPDLLPTNLLAPGSVTITQLNQRVEISWNVLNQGSGAAFPQWSDYLYISPTNILDASAVHIGTENPARPVASGQSYLEFNNPTLPNGIQGNYYLLMKADNNSHLFESSELNNLISQPIQIVIPPLPDLSITSVGAPMQALSGQEIEITWVLTNRGTAFVSAPFRESIYLSPTNTGASLVHYGTFDVTGAIAPGEAAVRKQRITLPINLSGRFWAVVVTDSSNQIFEFNGEDNNSLVSAQPVDVTLSPTPNLAVSFVTSPTNDAFSSQQTTVSWAVTNQGVGATRSPYWYDTVYLSTDAIFGNDTVLAHVPNASYLNADESYANSATVTLPRGINGTYYFLVRADAGNNVFENTDENDNLTASAPFFVTLTPPPDLRVDSMIVPQNAFSGQPVTLSWIITNNGIGQTLETSWNDRVYLSTNTILDGSDHLLDAFAHSGALAPGGSYRTTNSVMLPVGVAGEWYFIVQADAFNQVYEIPFEENNSTNASIVTTIALTPPPDLETTILLSPTNATSSRLLSVQYRVVNNGATVTPNSGWVDRLSVSADTIFDAAADTHLGAANHYGALLPGAGYTNTFNVVLPDTLTGNYYLFVQADVNNDVFELDNSNNVTFASNQVEIVSRPADLAVSRWQAPSSGEAGAGILVTWAVTNRGVGDTAVSRWRDRIVLSADDALGDGDDVTLFDLTRDGLLDAGAVYVVNNAFITIPIFTAPGEYRLFVVSDIDNSVYENNETNNASAPLPIAIARNTADLQITGVTVPASAVSGGLFTAQWVVQNFGNRTPNSSYWFDSVYLSTDALLSPGDILLGHRQNASQLAPGQTYTNLLSVHLPPNLNSNYFVIVHTDAANYVVEAGLDGNNTFIAIPPVAISLSAVPDLAVIEVDTPSEGYSGQRFDLSWTVQNEGGSAANGTWYDAVFLSLDHFLNPFADYYVGYVAHTAPLAPGQTYTNHASFEIPPGLSGPFFVIVSSDVSGNVFERGSEANNLAFDPEPMNIQLTPPVDLVAGPITIPANATPGVNAAITYIVYNFGSNTARGSWEDSIYISADTNFDIGDAFFGRVRHTGDILPNGSYTNAVTARLPGILPGDYHVIVRSDIVNNIPESDEDNNLGASLDSVAVDVENLTLGTPDSGTIEQGQSVFYRFDATAGTTVRIRFSTGIPLSGSELFVRRGQMPTRGTFDYAINEPFVTDPDLFIPIAETGTYYLLAYASALPEASPYSILAEVVPFTVAAVQPAFAGDRGVTTFKVRGALFDTNTLFALISGTNILKALQVSLDDSTTAYATFNLIGEGLGLRDLQASTTLNVTSIITATLSNAVTVVPGAGPVVNAAIDGPLAVWARWTQNIRLVYGNSGDSDADAPLILVYGREGTLVGPNPDDLRLQTFQVLGRSLDGPAQLLRPRATYTLPLSYRGGGLWVEARAFRTDDTTLITESEWLDIESSLRPEGVSDSAWLAFWANQRPRIGDQWGDYVRFVNRIAENRPAEERDVRVMIGTLFTNQPDFRASVALSGVLLDAADGLPLPDAEVALYSNSGSLQRLAGSAVADPNGNFTMTGVAPGTYALTLVGGQMDMDRDGRPDWAPPEITIAADSEPTNQTYYVYVRPAATGGPNDRNGLLVTDYAGTNHLVWERDAQLWHAVQTGTNWTQGQAVSTNTPQDFDFAAGPDLLDGSPGLITVWISGGGNAAEIFYSVAKSSTNGFRWSQPVQLTHDLVNDSGPAVVVTTSGHAVITYLKQNAAGQDDTDLYHSLIDLSTGDLVWSRPPLEPLYQKTVGTCNFSKKLYPMQLGDVSVGMSLDASISLEADKCDRTVAGQAGIKFTIDDPGDFSLSVNPYGRFAATWFVNPIHCSYELSQASATLGTTISYTHKDVLLRLLYGLGPEGPILVSRARDLLNKLHGNFGITLDSSATVTGNANITGVWKGDPSPLTNWRPPDQISSAEVGLTFNVTLMLYKQRDEDIEMGGALTSGQDESLTNALFTATSSATISGTWEIYPTFKLKLAKGEVNLFSIKVGPVTIGLPPLAIQYPKARLLDEFTLQYNPAGAVGSTNLYGTNTLLANAGEDLYRDGRATLATDQGGQTFAAWFKETDPYAQHFGSEVNVADFDGAVWLAPEVIPGSFGLNSFVNAAVDATGRRLLVWSHTETSGLTTNVTLEEFTATRAATDLFYSVKDGATWTAPQRLAITPGRDRQLSLCRQPDGNVLAVWLYNLNDVLNTNDTPDRLVAALWNGTSWTTPTEIASGEIVGPATGRLGDEPLVVWSQVVGNYNDTPLYKLFQSSFGAGTWSSPAQLSPTALDGLERPLPLTKSGQGPQQKDDEAPPKPSPLFQGCSLALGFPDADCCPCKNGKTIELGKAPGLCAIGKRYDTNNCIEYIYYKACPLVSLDPNDIVGPEGFGPERWVAVNTALNYTIRFENDALLASAPAKEVVVTLPLDEDFDARTFRLGSFGFGDITIPVPDNAAFYQTTLDLTVEKGFYLNFFAGVDVAKGEAFWRLTTIDPVTGFLPVNPLLGFLPPNVTSPEGEGFVNFSVRSKSGAVTGARLDAQARIVFDSQPPIDTPPIFNSVEAGLPASAVAALPALTNNSDFMISWSGSDSLGESGIASYTIYVSQDGGSYVALFLNTTLTEAPFFGEFGSSYRFYSVAQDNAGNVEAVPMTRDAEILIASSNTAPVLLNFTNTTVVEKVLFTRQIVATDADVPTNALTFELLAGPAGMLLDATSGLLSWTPTEAQGPTNTTVIVQVTDDGVPPLSATNSFTITVLETNDPPVFTGPINYTVDELTNLTFTNIVVDSDIPTNHITLELVSAPTGVSFDPLTGVVSWTPNESDGPGTNTVVLRATDDGAPSASAVRTNTIVVREVNNAPVFEPITNLTVNPLSQVRIPFFVTDADEPTNAITVSLDPGAPASAFVNTNDVFVWRPSLDFAGTSNLFTAIASDDGAPSLSATQQFVIVVNDYLSVSLGSAVLQVNQTGSVPVQVVSSAPWQILNFTLPLWAADFDNLALSNTPPFTAATLTPVDATRSLLTFSNAPGHALQGTQQLALLTFKAIAPASKVILLAPQDITATRTNGGLFPFILDAQGRIIIIAQQALLEALAPVTNQHSLMLFGNPGETYLLDTTTNLLDPIFWDFFKQVTPNERGPTCHRSHE